MKISRENLLLYAVTDRGDTSSQVFFKQIEQALLGGVTILQLREKNLSEEEFIKEAVEVKTICKKYSVPLIINDNVNVAIKSGADGVHVGIEDSPVSEIRKRVGPDFIIGATAKTIEQAKKAESDGADYLGVGAVFPSPTKTTAIRITKEQLSEICRSVSIPAVAIGGITLDNISTLNNCNISGVALVSAVFSADDIKEATTQLKQKAVEIV